MKLKERIKVADVAQKGQSIYLTDWYLYRLVETFECVDTAYFKIMKIICRKELIQSNELNNRYHKSRRLVLAIQFFHPITLKKVENF